jgi:hypothetical protein
MEKQTIASSLIPSKYDLDYKSLTINSLHYAFGKLKNYSFLGIFIINIIFLPSFLNVFSPESNWGLSTNAQTPNFVFDANDAHKGILIPRVSLLSATDTVTVPSPGVSLLLYNTSTVGISPNNLTAGFYFWNGTKWQSMSGAKSFVETFVEFYALMPSDNSATIAAGSPISFPLNGPTSGLITRSSTTPTSEFVIPDIGTYSITWQVSIAEAGQLVLMINGVENARTVVGRATGTSQIVGNTLLTTSTLNTTLSLNNPSGNPVALTISPIAGGTHPVSASIIIKRLQ